MTNLFRTALVTSALILSPLAVMAQGASALTDGDNVGPAITEDQVRAACGTDAGACAQLAAQLPAGDPLLELAVTVAATSTTFTPAEKQSVVGTAEGRLSIGQTQRVRQAVIAVVPPQQRGQLISQVNQAQNPNIEEDEVEASNA